MATGLKSMFLSMTCRQHIVVLFYSIQRLVDRWNMKTSWTTYFVFHLFRYRKPELYGHVILRFLRSIWYFVLYNKLSYQLTLNSYVWAFVTPKQTCMWNDKIPLFPCRVLIAHFRTQILIEPDEWYYSFVLLARNHDKTSK